MSAAARKLEPEEMDGLDVHPEILAAAHNALARLHRLSLSARTIGNQALRLTSAKKLRLLDIGCGDGWLTEQVAKHLIANGREVEAIGVDMSPIAISVAQRRKLPNGGTLRFFEDSAPELRLCPECDVAISSTFLHHLTESDAIKLLSRLQQLASAGVVQDLSRSRWSWWLVLLVSRIVSRSRMVHGDALRSVDAAFTGEEFRRLAQNAGITNAAVRASFPCHLLLTWKRS